MDKLIDEVAKILATPMPRRKTFRLLGGALAALFVSGSAFAGQKESCPTGTSRCGNAAKKFDCCNPGQCCAGNGANATCCNSGQCVCPNGTCASSTGGSCPRQCSRC
jgi:hypothetical protein